jgi:hypothetical protein
MRDGEIGGYLWGEGAGGAGFQDAGLSLSGVHVVEAVSDAIVALVGCCGLEVVPGVEYVESGEEEEGVDSNQEEHFGEGFCTESCASCH